MKLTRLTTLAACLLVGAVSARADGRAACGRDYHLEFWVITADVPQESGEAFDRWLATADAREPSSLRAFEKALDVHAAITSIQSASSDTNDVLGCHTHLVDTRTLGDGAAGSSQLAIDADLRPLDGAAETSGHALLTVESHFQVLDSLAYADVSAATTGGQKVALPSYEELSARSSVNLQYGMPVLLTEHSLMPPTGQPVPPIRHVVLLLGEVLPTG